MKILIPEDSKCSSAHPRLLCSSAGIRGFGSGLDDDVITLAHMLFYLWN